MPYSSRSIVLPVHATTIAEVRIGIAIVCVRMSCGRTAAAVWFLSLAKRKTYRVWFPDAPGHGRQRVSLGPRAPSVPRVAKRVCFNLGLLSHVSPRRFIAACRFRESEPVKAEPEPRVQSQKSKPWNAFAAIHASRIAPSARVLVRYKQRASVRLREVRQDQSVYRSIMSGSEAMRPSKLHKNTERRGMLKSGFTGVTVEQESSRDLVATRRKTRRQDLPAQ